MNWVKLQVYPMEQVNVLNSEVSNRSVSHKHPKKTGGDFRFPWWGLQSSCNCGFLLCKRKYGLFFIVTFCWCSAYCRLCLFKRHLLYRQINSSFAKDISNCQSLCCFLWLGWISCLTEKWENAHTFFCPLAVALFHALWNVSC